MHAATRGAGGRRYQHYSNSKDLSEVNSTPATPATKIKTNTTAKIADNQNRSITLRDIKLIMPTVLILLFTILIILTVIPYAFSSVIKQLKAVQAMEQAEAARKNISASSVSEQIQKHRH